MEKLLVVFFLLFVFSFPGKILASSARSVVETQVEAGEAQIYQSVQTTIDGQTIKKESNQPGKIELEMKKTDDGQPTVSFSQTTIAPTQTPKPSALPTLSSLTPTPTETEVAVEPRTVVSPIIDFFRSIFDWFKNLTSQVK